MQSCSNEFVAKFSKPKISKMPMNWVMSLPRIRKTTLTIDHRLLPVAVFFEKYRPVNVGGGNGGGRMINNYLGWCTC